MPVSHTHGLFCGEAWAGPTSNRVKKHEKAKEGPKRGVKGKIACCRIEGFHGRRVPALPLGSWGTLDKKSAMRLSACEKARSESNLTNNTRTSSLRRVLSLIHI